MKIRYAAAAIFIFLSLHSQAQLKGFSLGPYAELASPTGGLADTHKNGIGGGLNADIRFGKIGLTGSAGFIHFAGKTVAKDDQVTNMPDINAIPLRVGLKYRFVPLLYVKLEGGVAKYIDGGGSDYIISPGIGLRIVGLDVQAKYEVWTNDGSNSFWGLKLGYNF